MGAQKISSIEFGRVFAIFAILSMHSQMFLSYWMVDNTPWFGYIFNQSTRFAVPLFFLISGYLIQPKLESNPFTTLKRYSYPLLRIFVFWSIVCLLMPFKWGVLFEQGYLVERQNYWNYLAQAPLNSLLEGGLVHLWFIPALLLALAIGALLSHLKLQKAFVLVGFMLYVYGVLAGSYQGITDLPAPFFTRNGPFFSTLMVAIGFHIRRTNLNVSNYRALLLGLIGLYFHFKEAHSLHFQGHLFSSNDYLFGTALWATGCFMWLLANPRFGQHRLVGYLSPKVLMIFVIHLPLIIVMKNISAILGITGFAGDMLVLVGTVSLTLGLIEVMERSGVSRYLFR